MYVVNDFFLLVWHIDAKKIFENDSNLDEHLEKNLKENYSDFCDNVCILLSVSTLNIDKFQQIPQTIDALKSLTNLQEFSKENIWYAQKEILLFLNSKGSIKLNKEVQKRFDLLRKEGIVGYEKTRKLISFLALMQKKKEVVESIHVDEFKVGSNFYETSLNLLNSSIENLYKVIEEDYLKQRLQTITKKLVDEKFSIGITGVMNAGKSTMLNAILGKEVLGTSVIPETANLTVIKYAKDESAKVNFWNNNEWKNIQKSADTLENMRAFVSQTKEFFSDNLDEFITDEGRSDLVGIDELSKYTSAEHSDKKCNLVKSVELFTDLSFVKNGVEIVDTPGLDDPVVQREEITKKYLYDCDLMCHLMNVNQSATKKDVDFIVDTLVYQNIARLLVVITRIDTVSKEELDEVIAYTKSSIKNRLQSINKEAQFDSIVSKIDFIPIAGKMALYHRIGKEKEALKQGYDLKTTGILDVENYLNNILFGDDSQKAHLILQSNKKELLSTIKLQKESLRVQKELFGKSAVEIENESSEYQKQINKTDKALESLKEKVNDFKAELVSYFKILHSFSKNKTTSMMEIVKRRVLDDVSYEFRKNKKRPEAQRISYIVDAGIKDGYIDLIRDYRYEFEKRVQSSLEKIKNDFENVAQIDNSMQDSKEFFDKYFSHANFANSNMVLIQKINKSIDMYAKKDISKFQSELDMFFAESFEGIYSEFDQKSKTINSDLMQNYEESFKKSINDVEFDIKSKQKMFQDIKDKIQDKSFDTSLRMQEIEQKLVVLEKIEKNLTSLEC